MTALQSFVIEFESKKIKEKIIDGSVYGQKIEEDNIDAMLVAAYHLGRSDEREYEKCRYLEMGSRAGK